MLKFLSVCILLIFSGSLYSQNQILSCCNIAEDSLTRTANDQRNITKNRHSPFRHAVLPVSIITSGIIVESLPSNTILSKESIQKHVQDQIDGFRTSADNYLQFAPIATMFGLSLAGVKSRSDFSNEFVLSVKSELLMTAIVSSMKYFINDMRPDNTTNNTMPSGHTAQAFVSAALLDMEYREISPWISLGGYLCATATGCFRVANNRHWASDVLIGAGIGVGCVKVVYLTHRYRWGSRPTRVILIPTIYPKGGGVAFAMKF